MISDFLQNITKEEIEKLPLGHFDGEMILVDTLPKLKKAVLFLKKQTEIGFDTETKPAFVKGQKNHVALLQLSTNKKAFLFRIHHLKSLNILFELFANPNIIKIGADIGQDLSALQKVSPFKVNGFIDIQKYSCEFGIIDNGLKKLAAIVLGIKISKSQRLTNWEAPELTQSQMLYAATDAWVCLKIYQKLVKNKILNNSEETE